MITQTNTGMGSQEWSSIMPSTTFGFVTLVVLVTSNLNVGLSLLSSTSALSHSCSFPAIFNFGDSNSDTGGLTAAFGMLPPPYGETYFGKPVGRYTDGRLIIDFLAEGFGLPYLTAYLNSVGANYSHGANFATAGSTIRRQNTTMAQSGFSPISLRYQLAEYTLFQKNSQLVRKQGGVFEELLPEEDYFARALYTFDIGQNDITAGYKLGMSTDQVKAYVPDVLAEFSKVVKGVYAQGGRSFWIHNTGPLGCLPYMLDLVPITEAQVDQFGCSSSVNEAAQYYNSMLKEVVDQLRKDLPLASITYVDLYSIKYTLITQATKFGFEEPLIACCGRGGKYNYDSRKRCGSTEVVDGKKIVVAKPCNNPSVRVNWDGVHFTEAANKWIFDQMVNDVSFLDPPIPLKMACQVSYS